MAIRKQKKDRTGLIISIVAHVVVIGAVLFWLTGTKSGQDVARKILEAIRPPDKPKEAPKPKEVKAPPVKLPTINEGAPPKSSGTRRASAADAPAAVGDSFFVDTREQAGPSKGGAGEKKDQKKAAPVIIARPPPRVELRPPPSTGVGSAARLLTERQKSISSKDSIGSEAIERTTGSDVGDVLTKVTGASIVEGKFAVVRGLSDRYTLTTLNGADVPTPDPYRKSVQLDIFPAKTVESVTVTKTFTPDLPGSWAGGLIDIKTKSYPEKFTFSVSVGLGYNTHASLRDDFLSDGGESRDALAMGKDARALPAGLAQNSLPDPNNFATSRLREPLDVALLRRQQADQLAAMTRSFRSTTLGPVPTDSFLNQNHVISIGDTVRMFQRPLGYFAGFSYRVDDNAYDDGLSERYSTTQKDRTTREARATHEVSWSAVANLAYKLNPQHELAFNFLYNQSAENTARVALGTNLTTGPGGEALLNLNTMSYIERNLTTFQLRGGHEFPDVGNIRFDWLGALSDTSQDEPDLRFFNRYLVPTTNGYQNLIGDNSLPAPYRPTRYFRNIEENNKNLKADLTIPFRQWSDLESLLKGGLYQSKTERTFRERTFTYNSFLRSDVPPDQQDPWRINGTPNSFLDEQFLGYLAEAVPRRGRFNTNYYFLRYLTSELGNSRYDGDVTIDAGYGMIEIPLMEKVRLVGGARLEDTDLNVAAIPSNANEPVDSAIKQLDILPAAGLIWSVRSNMNVRLNWSKTLARPTFREIAPVRIYDIQDDVLYEGNPALRITGSENFDVRWEWFPRLGEVLSVSLFYKDLTDPIEKYSTDIGANIITFTNRPTGKVYGVEFEARKSLDFIDRNLANFSLGANVSLIYSETPLFPDEIKNKSRTDPDVKGNRPLYDQSPYIVNLDLTYNNPSLGTTITINANLSGERIYFAHPETEDIYDHPPTSLDVVVSQRLNRFWKVKLAAKNLLDSPTLRTLGPDANGPIYTKYTRGITFGASLSADF
jgi:TonB-dependent receptor